MVVVSRAELVVLNRPYAARKSGGTDINVRTDRWALVDERSPFPDWEERCLRARRTAEGHLKHQPDFGQACRRSCRRCQTAVRGAGGYDEEADFAGYRAARARPKSVDLS